MFMADLHLPGAFVMVANGHIYALYGHVFVYYCVSSALQRSIPRKTDVVLGHLIIGKTDTL